MGDGIQDTFRLAISGILGYRLKMLRIVSVEHFRADGPGKILVWIESRGHSLQRVLLQEGQTLPPVEDFDMLIVMGGPMNIYEHEEYPWLVEEKEFIRAAVDAGKPMLGVCLGGQLLADVLGGKVTRNRERELGWWPVDFTGRPGPFARFPERLMAFHWHGDTFSIPPGAEPLAFSEACDTQAFLYKDRFVGLQFHIEVWNVEAHELMQACPEDLLPARYVQTPAQILAPPPETRELEPALFSLLDALAAIAGRSVR